MYTIVMKARPKLNIKNYPENAANNFTLGRIVVYTLISLALSILLVITSFGYEGKAMIFTGIAFFMIAGYTILNIKALIIKIKDR